MNTVSNGSEKNNSSEQEYVKPNYPDEITVVLEETETIFLFDMPSVTVEKGTEEGDIAEKNNEIYEYLTVGKGKNRKTISNESQTDECILKTRSTAVPKIDNKNSYAFASAWDMYDSFKSIEKNLKICESELVENGTDLMNIMTDMKDFDMSSSIRKTLNFNNSAMIMERILANNVFNKQQEYFKGMSKQTTESESYLQYLWSFICEETRKKTVTAMCLNPKNSDILAIGYGKYYYVENVNGIVAVWNIKNPIQPERLINFKFPVTSMAFSKHNPNLLSIGFYNGSINILDISANDKKVIAESNRKTCPSYEPIWQTTWHEFEGIENVVSAGQDGRINTFLFTKTQDFVCKQLIRLHKVDGSIKGKFESHSLTMKNVYISQYSMCLVMCHHPTSKDIYFVGTMDGCIYKCSLNCTDQYIDVFSAHDGSINAIQFSPFHNNIFVTCGSDWLVKVWIEDVTDPLIIMNNSPEPVKSVMFCPTHSTIIVAINSKNMYLWDLKKNQMLLEEIVLKSNGSILTSINFTNDGKNVLIGDTNGNINVYNLVNICDPDFDEISLLNDALNKILVIKPELLKRVDQIQKRKKIQNIM